METWYPSRHSAKSKSATNNQILELEGASRRSATRAYQLLCFIASTVSNCLDRRMSLCPISQGPIEQVVSTKWTVSAGSQTVRFDSRPFVGITCDAVATRILLMQSTNQRWLSSVRQVHCSRPTPSATLATVGCYEPPRLKTNQSREFEARLDLR